MRYPFLPLTAFALTTAAVAQPALKAIDFASGFTRALALVSPPRDFHRLFVVEQTGTIKIIKDGAVLPTPFLNITPLVNSSTWQEWGLLGLAFHPQYATNGYFYIFYSDLTGNTVIARYTASANPDIADPASAQIVLTITQPNREHRAGWMAFGPDSYLYIASGDGGPENDPLNNGQNLTLLMGKMLRIDIDSDDFPADPLKNYHIPASNPFAGSLTQRPEIWSYGLRNPWRCSFDRATGNLWIADVGQSLREEIDFQPAAAAGGRNYGWPCTEGTNCNNTTQCTCNAPTMTPPLYEYPRTTGVSITGGYVYRGCAIPGLEGRYFFADWGTNKIWSLVQNGSGITELTDRTAALTPTGGFLNNIRSFGEDGFGEIYFCSLSRVAKIVPATFIGPDCNSNNRCDACDILSGQSLDANHNAIPDECEPPLPCYANCDQSTTAPILTANDFQCFLNAYASGLSTANCDQSTTAPILTANDFQCFLNAYAAGCT